MIFSIDDDVQEIQFVEASSGYGKGRDYLVHAPESKQSQNNNAGHYVSRDDFEFLRKLAREEQEIRSRAERESALWRDKFYEVNKIVQSLKNQLAEVATAKDRASERCAAKDADTRDWKASAMEWEKMYNVLYQDRCECRKLLQDAVSDKKKAEKELAALKALRGIKKTALKAAEEKLRVASVGTWRWQRGDGVILASEIVKLMEAKEQMERLSPVISKIKQHFDSNEHIFVYCLIPELLSAAEKIDE